MPQGTVKTFDPQTLESVLLSDDLVEYEVSAEAFRAAPLLELRVGQRVRYEIVDDGDGNETVGMLGIVSL